jgi:CDP-diacylglycerol---serine O-phosphatidyltransferase
MSDNKQHPDTASEQHSVADSGDVSASGASIESLNLIDEHEEEFSIDGKTVRRRGIYLLPNLFTTAALFFGFYAIISSMNGRFEAAAIAIFVAMVFDGLDGRVARLTHTQSKFGAEYDSLADMVSFGVAPSLVVFNWALSDLGKFGWAMAFIYVACAALRLARFNTQIEVADKNYFSGLASPAAAAVIAGVVWVWNEEELVQTALSFEASVVIGILTALAGFAMVLNVSYHSFKGLDLKGRVPFVVMILIIVAFGLVTVDPARVLLAVALLYAFSGPAMALYKRFAG